MQRLLYTITVIALTITGITAGGKTPACPQNKAVAILLAITSGKPCFVFNHGCPLLQNYHDSNSVVVTLDEGTPIFVDTSQWFSNHQNESFQLCTYKAHDTWQHGYLQTRAIATSFTKHPNNDSLLILTGFNEHKGKNGDYPYCIKWINPPHPTQTLVLGDGFYDDNTYTLQWITNQILFENIPLLYLNIYWDGCGFNSNNLVFACINHRWMLVTEYAYSGIELNSDFEVLYLPVIINNQIKWQAYNDGEKIDKYTLSGLPKPKPGTWFIAKGYEDYVKNEQGEIVLDKDEQYQVNTYFTKGYHYTWENGRSVLKDSLSFSKNHR